MIFLKYPSLVKCTRSITNGIFVEKQVKKAHLLNISKQHRSAEHLARPSLPAQVKVPPHWKCGHEHASHEQSERPINFILPENAAQITLDAYKPRHKNCGSRPATLAISTNHFPWLKHSFTSRIHYDNISSMFSTAHNSVYPDLSTLLSPTPALLSTFHDTRTLHWLPIPQDQSKVLHLVYSALHHLATS